MNFTEMNKFELFTSILQSGKMFMVFALSFLPIASGLAVRMIPASYPRDRLLFLWHAYDALAHVVIEGSFLYECFFSYAPIAGIHNKSPCFAQFLNRPDRFYGPIYGTGPSAYLWQEYAKADRRWAGADINIVSLQLLTVLIGGPLAIYICYLLNQSFNKSLTAKVLGTVKTRLWFFSCILATAELYGGFMTFAPEWLTGCSQLATNEPLYLWGYLTFFNGIWVVCPLWVLQQSYVEFKDAFIGQEILISEKRFKIDGTSPHH